MIQEKIVADTKKKLPGGVSAIGGRTWGIYLRTWGGGAKGVPLIPTKLWGTGGERSGTEKHKSRKRGLLTLRGQGIWEYQGLGALPGCR